MKAHRRKKLQTYRNYEKKYYRTHKKEKAAYGKEYRRTHKIQIGKRLKVWRRKNVERIRGYKLKGRYGITLEDYEKIFRKQKGLCAMCSKPPVPGERLRVDHDHETDEVRGLLHDRCNIALGLLSEDIFLFKAAIKYIRRVKCL